MGYYVFNPFTKKMDWTEAGGGGPSFASIWTSQLSFASATGGSMFASTVSFSSITTSHCTLNKNIYNYINLTMSPNVSFASAKVDVNADAMVLTDSTGYTIYSSTVDLTITMSVSGISGLMGSAEASSQWYHIWGISEGVNFTAILDSSDSSPTLPAGYSFKCYLGAVYNNASGNIDSFKQIDNIVVCPQGVALSAGTQTVVTEVNLATFVPTTARLARTTCMAYNGTGNAYFSVYADSGGVYKIAQPDTAASTGGTIIVEALAELPLITPQKTYYKCYAGTGSGYIYVWGWEY